MAPTEFCIGEKVASLRQLLKRMVMINPHDNSTGVTGIQIRPYTIFASYNNAMFLLDYFSIFGSCFAYNRGSVRIKSIGDITPGDRWAEIFSLNFNSPTDWSSTSSTVI